jgi:hypothetical protein
VALLTGSLVYMAQGEYIWSIHCERVCVCVCVQINTNKCIITSSAFRGILQFLLCNLDHVILVVDHS